MGCRRTLCCSRRMTRRLRSRRRCLGWWRPGTLATPMFMAGSSMRRCWASICRYEGRFDEPDDDFGRVSAGAELLELTGVVAASVQHDGFHDAGILSADRAHLG